VTGWRMGSMGGMGGTRCSSGAAELGLVAALLPSSAVAPAAAALSGVSSGAVVPVAASTIPQSERSACP